MLRRRTLIQGLLATVATPALAQNSFLTPGGSSVPGIVTMCLSSNVAVPCATGGGGSFPPNISGTQATIAADFAGQQYWASAASQASFAAWLTAIGGTYARASSATYLQGGVVKTAAANTPRFPTDLGGVPQGIRLTGAGTNILLSSNSIGDANWTVQSGIVATLNNVAAPDGTTTATKLDISAAPNTAGVFQVAGPGVNGSVNTKSMWVRADVAGGTVKIVDPAIGAGSTTATLTTSWQRVVLTDAAGSQPSGGGVWIQKTASSPNLIYVWGAQLTLTTFAVDDIYTTTATVTQAADSFSFPFTQTTFSALAGTNNHNFDGSSQRILGVSTSGLVYLLDTTDFAMFIAGGASLSVAVANVLGTNKTMVAGNTTSAAMTANGLVPAGAAGAISPAGPTTMFLGTDRGFASFAAGNFSQLAIWNGIVASAAEMVRLTT